MNFSKLVAVALVFSFSIQQSALLADIAHPGLSEAMTAEDAAHSSSGQSSQAANQSAEEEQFQLRRQNFTSGRELLLDRGVPFDPDELLRHGWSRKLSNVLDGMPEMHQARHETAPLSGVYMADTIYLPEIVQLSGHTVILTKYLVFEGNNPVIKGPYDLHVFPAQPITALGTTLPQALHKKAGLLNVSHGGRLILPSFALMQDLRQGSKHITFDTSGPEPQAARKPAQKSAAILRSASWNSLVPVLLQNQNTSGDTGPTGTPGISPPQSASGLSPIKAPNGSCAASFNGEGGFPGGDGAPGQSGGTGGPGGPGGNAAAINANIADGDFNQYSFIANGGSGGLGGTGGTGGMGGNGGRGGDGGDGVACGCQLGQGGDASHGGNGGLGGNGANGGVGGTGGSGGTITVSLPAGSPGAITSNFGGPGGRGGDAGTGGIGGNAGPAGSPGLGATACGATAANGGSHFGGNPGASGTPGAPGAFGSAGLNGPPPSITFRSSDGGGGGPVTCLGGSDANNTPDTGGAAPDCSPIIVDATGEGFHLTSAADGVRFDITGDGRPILIAWTSTGSGNGFLALDRNHNGTIDNGTELFGNFTPQPKSPTPNGFLALAEFDKAENGGNGDGTIDEHDAVFTHLVIWIDENHDGISQPNELHTLPELGIYSLSLKYNESRRVDQFGNVFRFRAKVNPGPNDGTSEAGRWAFDVLLTTTK